jgi:polyisoprenoid-binding protein YceI
MKKPVLIAVAAVVVLAVVGLGVYKIFLEDEAPAELGLSETSGSTTTTGDGSTDGAPASLDGAWTVRSEEPTQAGMRIKESFLSGLADHTAVGRTSSVEGSLTIDGASVSEGSFTVDLTSLEFTDAPAGLDVANRSRAMQDAGLQTDEFPDTTFELTEPIELGEVPAAGETITAQATGDLTLHGVTKSVTFSVDAQLVDGEIEVATTDPVEIVLTDYEIEAPVQGPVAEVADTGSFEFVIRLAKG